VQTQADTTHPGSRLQGAAVTRPLVHPHIPSSSVESSHNMGETDNLYGASGAAGTMCKPATQFNLTELDCITTYKVDAQIYLRSVRPAAVSFVQRMCAQPPDTPGGVPCLQHDHVWPGRRAMHRCFLLPTDLCICVQGSSGEHARCTSCGDQAQRLWPCLFQEQCASNLSVACGCPGPPMCW
jgi:hypothetical protein